MRYSFRSSSSSPNRSRRSSSIRRYVSVHSWTSSRRRGPSAAQARPTDLRGGHERGVLEHLDVLLHPVSEIPNGSASSVIVALPRPRRSRMPRAGRVSECREGAVDLRWMLNHPVQCCTRRPPAQARASVRSLNSTFTPSHRGGRGRLCCACTGSPTPGARGSWCCPRWNGATTCSRRHSPATPAGRRSRRRSAMPGAATRSSGRWTKRASTPPTWSAIRWVAISR